MSKVYILTETYESKDAIREFQILGTYIDPLKAREVMDDLISSDDYGLIKKNGIKYNNEKFFSTDFCDGFIEYEIHENNVIEDKSKIIHSCTKNDITKVVKYIEGWGWTITTADEMTRVSHIDFCPFCGEELKRKQYDK
jgi:hypothetical protein